MIRAARKFIYIVSLALIPLTVLIPRHEREPGLDSVLGRGWEYSSWLEEYVNENFPLKRQLSRLGMEISFAGGKREYNGIFIGNESLVKNIPSPKDGIVQANTDVTASLAEYVRLMGKQAYFALIPTASAISVQSVPSFAETLNQKELIESAYRSLTGKLTAIDAYLPLFTNRNQYVFYRTENNLTAYGGYYVYEAMVRRMLGLSQPTYSSYEIVYADYEFYGDLYGMASHRKVRPDVLILFKYARAEKRYVVVHREAAGICRYQTLFPEYRKEPGREMDVYLGGLSPVTDIYVSSEGARSLGLLVLGDSTALAYLPFLANCYSHITFVDLSQAEELFEDISVEDYDQVLIAYSVETYVSPEGIPSRAELLVER